MCSTGRLQAFKIFSTVLKTSFVCRVKLTDLKPAKHEGSFRVFEDGIHQQQEENEWKPYLT